MGREHSNSLWQQDSVRPAHRVLTPALPTQPERVSTTADKGWVLECGVWRADQGSGLLWVLCEEPSCRKGREGGALLMGILRRKPEPPYSMAPLLTDDERRTPLQPLSPCAGPCLASVEEGLPLRWALLSPSHGLPQRTSSTISRLLCSGEASGADTCGWATCVDGAESTASPRVKEEKLKPLLTVAQTMLLHSQPAL